jgi:hypothetical protein
LSRFTFRIARAVSTRLASSARREQPGTGWAQTTLAILAHTTTKQKLTKVLLYMVLSFQIRIHAFDKMCFVMLKNIVLR